MLQKQTFTTVLRSPNTRHLVASANGAHTSCREKPAGVEQSSQPRPLGVCVSVLMCMFKIHSTNICYGLVLEKTVCKSPTWKGRETKDRFCSHRLLYFQVRKENVQISQGIGMRSISLCVSMFVRRYKSPSSSEQPSALETDLQVVQFQISKLQRVSQRSGARQARILKRDAKERKVLQALPT